MRSGTTKSFAALVAAILVAMTALIAGCGGGTATESAPPKAVEGTAVERAAKILGHQPTGLAKAIVDKGTMVVSTDANYAPQSSLDKKTGELVGFDIDVAKRTASLLGLKVKFAQVQWDTIPSGLIQKRFDVSIGSMTPTKERAKTLDFTDPYYYASGQVFVKKGGPQITGVADLAGKKVGVGAATTYYEYLKKNSDAIVKTQTTDLETFPDLRNGNLDFIMTAGPTGQEAINQGQPFEFSGEPLFYDDLSFAVKKNEADWLTLLNYAVKTMHDDGSLSDMSKTWYAGLDLTKKSK